MMSLRAIIWALNDSSTQRSKQICLDWCERHHADIIALMCVDQDAAAEQWRQVVQMVRTGAADYLVVARADHLPAERLPRIIVVADEPPSRSRRRHERRPRLIE